MGEQTVFARTEQKYLISQQMQQIITEEAASYMRPDEYGRSLHLSLYLDTPDFLLARRSLDHPLYREKLRVRSYGRADEHSKVYVELKKKYDSIVYKRRVGMNERHAMAYIASGQAHKDSQVIREISYALLHYHPIEPKILISYERESYEGIEDPQFRLTFDDHILWRTDHLSLCEAPDGEPLLPKNRVLLEVKSDAAMPLWLVRLFSAQKIYRTNFSKYGTAYARSRQKTQTGQSIGS